MQNSKSIVERAWRLGIAVPALNVPYLGMVRPVIRAAIDRDAFALVEVARIEWQKFGCIGPAAVMEDLPRDADLDYVRLHLDHIPVIDEETGEPVDYLPVLEQALGLGFH